jgi:hypothetical protein
MSVVRFSYTRCFRSWGVPCNTKYYTILKNFSLNLLSKMFVLTKIIDCIFLLFSKTIVFITDVAQDGLSRNRSAYSLDAAAAF